jgi:hypothetical protein
LSAELECHCEIEARAGENLVRFAARVFEVTRSTDYSKGTSLWTLGHNRSTTRDVKRLGYIGGSVLKDPAPTLKRPGSTARISFNVECTWIIMLYETTFVHIDVKNQRSSRLHLSDTNGQAEQCHCAEGNHNTK